MSNTANVTLSVTDPASKYSGSHRFEEVIRDNFELALKALAGQLRPAKAPKEDRDGPGRPEPKGEITFTHARDRDGVRRLVAVTRQDSEGRVLEVLWEAPPRRILSELEMLDIYMNARAGSPTKTGIIRGIKAVLKAVEGEAP